jgi:hypothetical protein
MWTGTPAVSASVARVAQDVKGARGDTGRLAVTPEPFGESLGMDRPAEPIGEHEIPIDVGFTSEIAFE